MGTKGQRLLKFVCLFKVKFNFFIESIFMISISWHQKYILFYSNYIRSIYTVFEIRTFHLVGYFLGNAEEPLNLSKQEIQKSALSLEVTATYTCSVGFVIFQFEPYEIPIMMSLKNFFSYIYILVFAKICLISSSKKYPQHWSFKLAKSNQFKADIKSRIGLT